MRKLHLVAMAGAAMATAASGLFTIAATSAGATPGANSVCAITALPSNVNNTDGPHTNQPNLGTPTAPKYGLYYPVTDPNPAHVTPRNEAFSGGAGLGTQIGDHYSWSQNGACANNNAAFSASGTGIGFCGRSVGLGAGTLGGKSYIVKWESAGSQLHLIDPSATGTVNAQANPPGSPNGSCLSGTAVTFLVDGAIADLR